LPQAIEEKVLQIIRTNVDIARLQLI